MNEYQKLYCQIFTDSDMPKKELISMVCRVSNGKLEKLETVSAQDFEVDVITNDEFNKWKRSRGDDQFLFYRYYLDVMPTRGTSRQGYINGVGDLLEGLWEEGCKAVAACSFEDELPRNGGYKWQRMGGADGGG